MRKSKLEDILISQLSKCILRETWYKEETYLNMTVASLEISDY